MRLYPVDGDTAIAELMLGGRIWGDLRLEGINLDAVDAARTASARVVLRLYSDRTTDFDFQAFVDLLREAEAWLIENEQGRTPIEE
jgi:hypothetical protein